MTPRARSALLQVPGNGDRSVHSLHLSPPKLQKRVSSCRHLSCMWALLALHAGAFSPVTRLHLTHALSRPALRRPPPAVLE